MVVIFCRKLCFVIVLIGVCVPVVRASDDAWGRSVTLEVNGQYEAAARSLDAGESEAPKLVSLAKARCSDALVQVGNESVQMHGGIGMTDEHDIGFYLKRARAAAATFGDAAFHRERWARLQGY